MCVLRCPKELQTTQEVERGLQVGSRLVATVRYEADRQDLRVNEFGRDECKGLTETTRCCIVITRES